MSSDTLFIVNPVSGPVSQRFTKDKVHRLLLEAGVPGQIEETAYAGHAKELAKQAVDAGIRNVISVGGDGTANEVASVLQDSDSYLGIIPRGSGNGLARHLRIPMDARQALGIVKTAHGAAIDSGSINSKPFFCTAGIGFDGYISGVFAASKKRGLLTYAQLTLANFLTYEPTGASIVVDGERTQTGVFVLAFANASQYGNNAFIAPMADITDGLLDVCLIRKLTFASALEVGYGLMNKTLATSSHTEYRKGRKISVQFDKPCAFHTDGEYAGNNTHFEVEIYPLSLKVLQPEIVT